MLTTEIRVFVFAAIAVMTMYVSSKNSKVVF